MLIPTFWRLHAIALFNMSNNVLDGDPGIGDSPIGVDFPEKCMRIK